MLVELSIKEDYRPNWGVPEGIRELVQNCKDADTQFAATMHIEHSGKKLVLTNDYVTLDRKSLLLGMTTKKNDDATIGQWGDGLKIGSLALVRKGRKLKIFTKDEIWTPVIVESRRYKEKVLAFRISKAKTWIDKVRVEVDLSSEEWGQLRKNFLFLYENLKQVRSYDGNLLYEEGFEGRIYVKDVFVCINDHLGFGYNFKDVALDVDRQIVDTYSANYRARHVVALAFRYYNELSEADQEIISRKTIAALNDVTEDLRYLTSYEVTSEFSAFTCEWFLKVYGQLARPARDEVERKRLQSLGYQPVSVSAQLSNVLRAEFGTTEELAEEFSKQPEREYPLSELSEIEQEIFESALNLTSVAIEVSGNLPAQSVGDMKDYLDNRKIKIVDFKSEGVKGIFDKKKEAIFIARRTLKDGKDFLNTLVHEISHFTGADGSREHVDTIQEIMGTMVMLFANRLYKYILKENIQKAS